MTNHATKFVGLLLTALLAGCASTTASDLSETSRAVLPRPDRILVYDFAYSPAQVTPDTAIGARLLELSDGESLTAAQEALGAEVSSRLAADLGAGRTDPPGGPPANSVLEVEGQFVQVREGNRLRRIVIGLGAGKSLVDTHVQVYEATPAGRIRVLSFTTNARSSLKPGVAETLAVGVIEAGVSAVTATATDSRETALTNAQRTAKLINRYLTTLAYQHDWITREAMKAAR